MKTLLFGDFYPYRKDVAQLFVDADVEALFGDSLSLFENKDFIAINLECAITDKDTAIAKHGPNLKAPIGSENALKKLGVNLAGLSNNHVFDFGVPGIIDTMESLKRAGIDYTGFGDNYEDSRKDYIFEKNGEKIAVIAVCEHEYSYAKPDKMGSRPFDEFDTLEDIRRANAECDRVIVMYHGGKEHCRYPSPRLMRACRAMVRAGADVVLCQHTHCISCYENYEGGHILYGQGNSHFLWPYSEECWESALAVEYDTVSGEIDFVPLHTPNDEKECGISLAKGEERDEIMKGFATRSASLLDGTWIDGWREFCASVENQYRRVVAKASTPECTEKDNLQFAHYLDCEAHLDVFRELYQTYHMKDVNY
ncbi:MAG: CapA family protein [Clostridia bacterium]|nr:CapA family protein [Clostridia bacterium]